MFYYYQWLLLGLSPGKFLLWYFSSGSNGTILKIDNELEVYANSQFQV